MGISTKELLRKENLMGRESIYGLMDLSTKEVLRMDCFVDMEFGNQNRMIPIKVNTEIIRKMERGLILGAMV